jgi:WD40 repeat protein
MVAAERSLSAAAAAAAAAAAVVVQVLKCKLSPDLNYLATASADATIRLWRTEDLLGTTDASPASSEGERGGGAGSGGEPEPELVAPPIEAAAAAGPGTGAAVPHKELKGHQRWVWDCCFSADSAYLVSSSSDQTAKLWDLASSEPIQTYSGHTKAVTTVSLNDVDTTSPA